MSKTDLKEAVKEAIIEGDESAIWNLLFEDRVLEMKVREKYEGLVRLCHAGKSRKLKRKF